MGLFRKLRLREDATIDWEMTPEYTFGTFESWGGRERLRNNDEQVYYFFVDAWEDPPRLYLMERAVKHARIVAEVKASDSMIKRCVKSQGRVARFERTFAINEELRRWLLANVVDTDPGDLVVPVVDEGAPEALTATGLPHRLARGIRVTPVDLSQPVGELTETEIEALIRNYDFTEQERNPSGSFPNLLVDNGDGLTVTDHATGLVWQRGGTDIMSHRAIRKEIERINEQGFVGQHDWRLPTVAEAVSLLEGTRNHRGLYLHPCFSAEQPFIFVDAKRRPGGYWFVDFKQGRVFWSSGTIPGGFGRLCRSLQEKK